MQGFIPIVISGKFEPLDRRRLVLQLCHFLCQRHAANQVIDAFAERLSRLTPDRGILDIRYHRGFAGKGFGNLGRIEGKHGCPRSVLHFECVKLGIVLMRLKRHFQRPPECIIFMIDYAGDITHFSCLAGGLDNIEILGQYHIAGNHGVYPLPRLTEKGFRLTDQDLVLACRQIGNADAELFSIDFFTKCRLVAIGSLDCNGVSSFVVGKLAGNTHLVRTGAADFLGRKS